MRAAPARANRFGLRFAVAAVCTAALILPVVPAGADEANVHVCLNQRERRIAIENGTVIRLASAIRAAKHRMPGTVVRARLCRAPSGLVYILTVLAHNGRVARLTVDAVKGTLVGGL
jgi:uncharacterized membrane protein YkoI